MARQKKHRKKSMAKREREQNLPTQERMDHGGIVIRSNRAQAEDPLRIDKLLKNGIIDEMQHLYGMQIITLWTIASRPFIKISQYEQRSLACLPDFNAINLTRMSAEDQFHKTMGMLRAREHEIIRRICFEEQGAIEAGRAMGLAVNSITVYVRAAFDALGDALARMRDMKRQLETPAEKNAAESERT